MTEQTWGFVVAGGLIVAGGAWELGKRCWAERQARWTRAQERHDVLMARERQDLDTS